MASTLAQQLQLQQQLHGAPAPGSKRQKGKPSLLFDPQKAADVDGDTLYELGCQGLSELVRLNPAYGTLKEALFSRAAASLVRDQQQPEAIAQLNTAIHEFCSMLSQHFLASGSFKALEYLIRKFRVHEHNTSSLMLAALPYHATNEFVLLVKTMPLDAARGLWGWLAPMQGTGAALVRSVLVQRCINDPQLLTWLGESARAMGTQPGRSAGVFLSFYATVMCEVITQIKVLDEQQVARVLPYVESGLGASASADYRAATLMMVGTLVSRATLSKEVAKALVNSMLRHHPTGQKQEGLLLRVLALVCATQPALKTLPDRALKALIKLPSLPQDLAAVHQAGVKLTALLRVLTVSLLKRLPAHSDDTTPLLLNLVQSGLLSTVAESAAQQLLEHACPEDATQQPVPAPLLEATQQLLRALDTHYPAQTDAAVNALLEQYKVGRRHVSKGDKDGSDSDSDEEGPQDAEAKAKYARAGAVFALVQTVFAHTARAPCGDSSMTLAAAATAPAAQVRLMALETMDRQLASGAAPAAAAEQMSTTILNGLRDDDFQVVAAVLGLPSLREQPVAVLLPVLTPALLRACSVAYNPTAKDEQSKAGKASKHARAALVAGLQLLGALAAEVQTEGEAAAAASEAVQQELNDLAVLLVLQCLLPAQKHTSVMKAAVSCAANLKHQLLSHHDRLQAAISQLEQQLGQLNSSRAAGKADKEDRKAAKHEHHVQRDAALVSAEQAVVTALAHSITQVSDHLESELRRLLTVARQLCGAEVHGLLRARHLVVMAVNVSLSKASRDGERKRAGAAETATVVARTLLQLSLDELLALGHSSQDFRESLKCLDDTGLPCAEHNTELQNDPLQLHLAVLQGCLLSGIELLPAGAKAEQAGQTLLPVFCQVANLEPQGMYGNVLKTLLSKQCPQPQQQLSFLAALFCSPEPGPGVSAAVVVAALRVVADIAGTAVHHVPHTATPVKGKGSGKAADSTTAEMVTSLLHHVPHLVVALSDRSPAVRLAAVAAVEALAAALAEVPAATHPAVSSMAQLLAAVLEHKDWLASDPSAAVAVFQAALVGQQPAGAPAAKSGKGAGRAGGRAADSTSKSVSPAAELLAQLLPQLADSQSDVHAADSLLQCLTPPAEDSGAASAAPAFLAGPCVELLSRLVGKGQSALTELQATVAARAVPAAVAAHGEQQAAVVSELFLQLLAATPASPGAPAAAQPAWFSSTASVRLAAIRQLSEGHVPDGLQQQDETGAQLMVAVLQSLAVAAAGDPSSACREAARQVLEALPVSAAHITPVLKAATQQQQSQQAAAPVPADVASTPSKKKKKGQAPAVAAPVVELQPPGLLEQAVTLLEMLQWKTVAGEEDVVAASQGLLSCLQPAMAPLVEHQPLPRAVSDAPLAGPPVPAGLLEDDDGDKDDLTNNAVGASPSEAAGSSLAGYAAQLILLWLAGAAQRQLDGGEHKGQSSAGAKAGGHKKGKHTTGAGDVFDMELVVKVAKAAPDSAARNAALSLLSLLARLSPEKALEHVLQVLALVNVSAGTSDDVHSQQVAHTAMSAVVPPWVASGRDITQLWEPVVAALPALPTHRRLALLTTLFTAAKDLPAALPAGLLVLLQHVVRAQEQQLAAGKQQQAAAEALAADQPAAEWLLQLAAQLASQVPLESKVEAFASLLKSVLHTEGGKAHTPLARLTVTFIAGQLQSKVPVMIGTLDTEDTEEGSALQAACEALMTTALDCVRRLTAASEGAGAAGTDPVTPKGKKSGKEAAQGAAPAASGGALSKREERAIRTSIQGLYSLFEALQGVMPPHSYLQALLRLAAQPSDKVQRRALQLFANRAATLPADFLRIAEHPAHNKKSKAAAAQRLAQSALQVVPLVESLSKTVAQPDSASAYTHQGALMAYSHVVTACGADHAADVSASVPAVLRELTHTNAAVRGSALAALTAAVRACKAQLLPQLPAVAKATLHAVSSAAATLATSGEPAAPRKRTQAQEPEDPEGQQEGAESAAQLAAIEVRAGLETLLALVTDLGAFISPYLPAMLQVLLHPAVLSCQASGCAAAATAVRSSLPQSVAPRLLLDPLFNSLAYAMESGLPAVQALLLVITATTQHLDAAAAGTHADAVFAFLLRALDVRSNAPASLRGQEHLVEQAVVEALVALTLKLSEARFKPLFLRLLEWASSPGAGGATSGSVGRLTSLFSVAAGLAEKLRSVFVPYYRHLLDLAVKHLQPQQAAKGSTKKRKQSGEQAVASHTADAVAEWVLRVKIVRALHRCFLYDSVGWLDGEKVNKLLPPLVAQLKEAPANAAAAEAVVQQCMDAELDATVKLAARSPQGDVAGTAAVAALVQLAVATNSDVHWKPLNHQVLMTTRGGNARTRCLALEVVSHMVDRLREEYVSALMAETLPFLSELLEDPEVSVESLAQQVLLTLESVSGEKLDQYLKT